MSVMKHLKSTLSFITIKCVPFVLRFGCSCVVGHVRSQFHDVMFCILLGEVADLPVDLLFIVTPIV